MSETETIALKVDGEKPDLGNDATTLEIIAQEIEAREACTFNDRVYTGLQLLEAQTYLPVGDEGVSLWEWVKQQSFHARERTLRKSLNAGRFVQTILNNGVIKLSKIEVDRGQIAYGSISITLSSDEGMSPVIDFDAAELLGRKSVKKVAPRALKGACDLLKDGKPLTLEAALELVGAKSATKNRQAKVTRPVVDLKTVRTRAQKLEERFEEASKANDWKLAKRHFEEVQKILEELCSHFDDAL